MSKPKYEILTWDTYKQEFTPQAGVRRGPYALFGLRKAIRKLKSMGYGCERWDNSVRVVRIDLESDKEPSLTTKGKR